LFAAAQTLSAVATLCIPALARQGVEYMILGRFLVGIGQVSDIRSLINIQNVATWH